MSTDKFQHECGVFGVLGHDEAANLTYLGLQGLQHRGQESAGIASVRGGRMRLHRRMGLVPEAFDRTALDELAGSRAIGHVRYSTAGGSDIRNAQPFVAQHRGRELSLAHNGNLTNANALRDELEATGSIFQTTSDSEIVLYMLARAEGPSLTDRVAQVIPRLEGAFSLLVMDAEQIVAARDPFGFRPLVVGRLGDAYVLSSETCALKLIEAELVREVEPGEIVTVGHDGMSSIPAAGGHPIRRCIFEHIYFSRPDSVVFGESVYKTRKELGRELAREAPAPSADVVIPVPDSGVGAALGFAQEHELPYEMGLIRSHYVGRTFIEPQQSIRHFGVRLKLAVNEELVRDRSIVVVDDSIVRGTTSRKLVTMLKAQGATEVHVRVSCPPTRWPCYYGIDTPTRDELIAAQHSLDEIRSFLGADSLGYLSIGGMHRAYRNGRERDQFCDACFSGEYPIPV